MVVPWLPAASVARTETVCDALLSEASMMVLGVQVFMTGADPQAFAELAGRAQVFEVTPGEARPQ